MIRCVSLSNFKRFSATKFDLHSSGLSFLAGGNNSGKSTLLQALAIWEFCKTVLEMERGPESLRIGYNRQGLGISDDEFSPVAVASLKHLWTNLTTQVPGTKDGYSLSVRCEWKVGGVDKHLQISLALANDRLFIKAGSSDLGPDDVIPHVTYLPPFAGMVARETQMSVAQRRALIGRGLAGGVIRNFLYDMYRRNEQKREQLKGIRTKIKNSDLAKLRAEDAWERLQLYLGENFNTQLVVYPFNDLYHNYIRIETVKGTYSSPAFKRYPNFKPRDLMSEGSGFLQMLSVFALALSPDTETLLLDEPDAHMHSSLQSQLTKQLEEVSDLPGKQILLATHSTEILRYAEHDRILRFKGAGAKYLEKSEQKMDLFLNLGSDYSPKIDPLRKHKRMLIVENRSDERLLKAWAKVLGNEWPENIICWPWAVGNKERKHLFLQLRTEIPELEALSLVDRDELDIEQVDKNSLKDKSLGAPAGMHLRVWRRRHIENYLMCPPAIARVSGWPLDAIESLMAEHAIVVPADFVSKDVASGMLEARGKEIIQEHSASVKAATGVTPLQIAEAMLPEEVPEDVSVIINQLIELSQTVNEAGVA